MRYLHDIWLLKLDYFSDLLEKLNEVSFVPSRRNLQCFKQKSMVKNFIRLFFRLLEKLNEISFVPSRRNPQYLKQRSMVKNFIEQMSETIKLKSDLIEIFSFLEDFSPTWNQTSINSLQSTVCPSC